MSIRYVNFTIETFSAVSCSMFDSSFDRQYKTWQSNDLVDLNNLKQFLNKFKKVKKEYIDTRGQITYIFDSQLQKMCFTKFGIFTDGITYYENPELLNI